MYNDRYVVRRGSINQGEWLAHYGKGWVWVSSEWNGHRFNSRCIADAMGKRENLNHLTTHRVEVAVERRSGDERRSGLERRVG